MYKIDYTKLAKMPDGTNGNISQGEDTAYMTCPLSEIETKLQADLCAEDRKHKFFPIINSVTSVDGHFVR